MRIKQLCFVDNPVFGTITIDFPNAGGLNTTVFTGINGSGKTTILVRIHELLNDGRISREDPYLRISDPPHSHEQSSLLIEQDSWTSRFTDLLDASTRLNYFYEAAASHCAEHPEYGDPFTPQLMPKCVSLPSEINFNRVLITTEPFVYKPAFINVVEESFAQVVPNYLATCIDRAVYQNDGLPARSSVDRACAEINGIFDSLGIDVRLTGLRKDGTRLPQFTNRAGKVFDISGLSSGEKQLFFRIMALKMIGVEDSVILIDEPEISLHPAWQQRILKVYESLGRGNQIIVATHSPHVVGSTGRENLKLLTRVGRDRTIEVTDGDKIPAALGTPAERVLTELMGLSTTRDPGIQAKIEQLWQDVFEDRYEEPGFGKRFDELELLLGTHDDDLAMMKYEIGRRMIKPEGRKDY